MTGIVRYPLSLYIRIPKEFRLPVIHLVRAKAGTEAWNLESARIVQLQRGAKYAKLFRAKPCEVCRHGQDPPRCPMLSICTADIEL